MKNKKRAFTIIELIATLTLLAIILAITVPVIQNLIRPSTISAFKSDARLVLRTALSKNERDSSFDVTSVNAGNLDEQLSIRSENFKTVGIEKNSPNVSFDTTAIRIEGQGRWDGYYACGTYSNMRVTQDAIKCTGDLFPPILTILGNNPENIFLGEAYSDAGATAIDAIDGDLTSKIVVESSLNVNVPGTYTIIYTVTDSNDNATIGRRKVNVIDNVGPRIAFTPNGNNVYAKSYNTIINVTDDSELDPNSYKYVWTTSSTTPDKSLFVNVYTDGQTISTPSDVTGNYYLWAVAKDKLGNETYISSNQFNLDNTIPVITLKGSNSVSIGKGSTYNDLGATAIDGIDGDISANIVVTGTVNPGVVGTYTITYNVSDSSGNAAIAVTRIVNVIDVSAPVITILGSNPFSMYAGGTYTDAGATAIDDVDGDVTGKIVVTGTVNPSIVGTYTITYTVKDNANNQAVATRTVYVTDSTPPSIVFGTNGNTTYARSRSTTVTLSDSESGVNSSSLKYQWTTSTTAPTEASFSTSFTNGATINTPGGITGGYYLWILAKDNATNIAIMRSNVFNLDNTAPTVPTFMGMTFADGVTNYTNNTWAGQAVYIYGGISGSTDVGSGVSKYQLSSNNTTWYDYVYDYTNPLYGLGSQGTQYRYARAVDGAGNISTSLTKTIKIDTTAPTISITGGSSISINLGSAYTDAGATATDSLSGVNGNVTSSGSVNVNATGTYTITYSATDYAGITATATRTVTVNALMQYRYRDSYSYQSCSTCTESCPRGCSTTAVDHYGGTPPDTWYWYTSYECGCGSYDSSYGQCIEWYSCGTYDCNCTTQTGWYGWSTWSTTAVTSSSTRQVETRSCTTYPCPTT